MQRTFYPLRVRNYVSGILNLTAGLAMLTYQIVLMTTSKYLDWTIVDTIFVFLNLFLIVMGILDLRKKRPSHLPEIVTTDKSVAAGEINIPFDAVDWEALDLTRPNVVIHKKGKHWADSIPISFKRYETALADALGSLKAEHSKETQGSDIQTTTTHERKVSI